jgi:hypothetical protein
MKPESEIVLTMSERDLVVRVAEDVAQAIGRKDVAALRTMMAPGFVHRTPGGAVSDAETFLKSVAEVPVEIVSIQLEALDVDMTPLGALGTGVQFAQVRIDDQIVGDRRGFVDWFVKEEGVWKIQAAVDLPPPVSAEPPA